MFLYNTTTIEEEQLRYICHIVLKVSFIIWFTGNLHLVLTIEIRITNIHTRLEITFMYACIKYSQTTLKSCTIRFLWDKYLSGLAQPQIQIWLSKILKIILCTLIKIRIRYMSTKMIPSKNIHICVQEINDFTKKC